MTNRERKHEKAERAFKSISSETVDAVLDAIGGVVVIICICAAATCAFRGAGDAREAAETGMEQARLAKVQPQPAAPIPAVAPDPPAVMAPAQPPEVSHVKWVCIFGMVAVLAIAAVLIFGVKPWWRVREDGE